METVMFAGVVRMNDVWMGQLRCDFDFLDGAQPTADPEIH